MAGVGQVASRAYPTHMFMFPILHRSAPRAPTPQYMLRLHASPVPLVCADLPTYDRGTLTAPSLVAQGRELLTLARVRPPGMRVSNSTCLVGNADAFSYPRVWSAPPAGGGCCGWAGRANDRFAEEAGAAAVVLAEYAGATGGRLLIIDRVLTPTRHPWARFPVRSLAGYIAAQPELRTFSRLLIATGLQPCLEAGPPPPLGWGAGPTTGCPGGMPGAWGWDSRTVFAPVNAAFARLSPALQAWLFDPSNVAVARYIALVRVGVGVGCRWGWGWGE